MRVKCGSNTELQVLPIVNLSIGAAANNKISRGGIARNLTYAVENRSNFFFGSVIAMFFGNLAGAQKPDLWFFLSERTRKINTYLHGHQLILGSGMQMSTASPHVFF